MDQEDEQRLEEQFLVGILMDDAEAVENTLRSGLLPDVRIFGHNATALIVSTNRESLVKLLLSYNATVNVHDVEGVTPLQNAIMANNVASVKLLIDRGADLKDKSLWGTPLEVAIGEEAHEIVDLLRFRMKEAEV